MNFIIIVWCIVWGILGIILFFKIWQMANDVHKFANFTSQMDYFAYLAQIEAEAGNTEKELEYLRKICVLNKFEGKYITQGSADLKKISDRMNNIQ